MTTSHPLTNPSLTEAEALAKVESDAPEWTEVVDHGEVEAIRRQARLLDDAAARLDAVVIQGRRRGLTWAQIGDVLGISHQAAHKRYAARV